MSRMKEEMLEFIKEKVQTSSAEIAAEFVNETSLATIKRMLLKLVTEGMILKTGTGKNTRYNVSNVYTTLATIDIETYFAKEIDQRKIQGTFNVTLIEKVLSKINLFSAYEIVLLDNYHKKFIQKSETLSKNEWRNEMERLAIDLSWKSSQIEGNTYSLLETEQLLKEKKNGSWQNER